VPTQLKYSPRAKLQIRAISNRHVIPEVKLVLEGIGSEPVKMTMKEQRGRRHHSKTIFAGGNSYTLEVQFSHVPKSSLTVIEVVEVCPHLPLSGTSTP
jgi:hypothetical protein